MGGGIFGGLVRRAWSIFLCSLCMVKLFDLEIPNLA